ncbi:MAG: hypothetical protein EZS28_034161, partial [Streblomastix strix]
YPDELKLLPNELELDNPAQ